MTGLFSTAIFAQQTFEFKKQIITGTDDAEERQTGGTIDITSSDIELVFDGSTVGNQTVGLRFTGIDIPKDATIVSAYIQFWVDEIQTATTNLTIRGEANDNSPTFSAAAFNISTRTKTTASVAWSNLPLWPTLNAAGPDQRTPDISSVVKEIMGRGGWNQGNALTILINGSGRRNAHAYEGSTTMAPQLIINYIPKKAPVVNFPISKLGVWMYHDSGQNLETAWVNNQYADSNWKFYLGKFGYGEGNEKTTINYGPDASNKYMTTYFRKAFMVADSTAMDSLLLNILCDDGAVVYLNGVEAFRHNMPSGTINHKTAAVKSVFGSDESAYFEYRVGGHKLRNGLNVIAVEVHQADPESADKGFDLEMYGKKLPMSTENFPLKRGADWYFNDKGVELYGSNWTEENYPQETLWDYGKAPLGYGDPMTTTLSFGPNSANKYVTYYFRKKIFIADTAALNFDLADFNIRRDDGAVVFVNGVEVLRQNMPTGPLNNRSISSSIVDGTNETTYFTTTLPKSIFKNGVNQIAVAIHQRDSISSDLGFDMEIVKQLKPNRPAMGCVDGENHIACFTSLTPAAQTTSLILPSTHSFQQILKQGTPYTNITGTIPTNHDFTAYVPRNGSSRDGVIAVNHENSPGAVSLAFVRYIDSTQLWNIDSTKAVDFGPVLGTGRNCSGGITPWGTVITSEETTSTSDANLDGYMDLGWNVEFNPWTGKVVDYGTGKPQKIWGMGRMNHENVVVAKDSVTVYQGEDGGTHLVYKFVADQKANLSSGKLYVLRLNNALVSGEPTGTTGRWIRVPNATPTENNNCPSLALAVGGTQFNGVEDVEIGTLDGKIYFTAKGLNRTYRFKDADTTFTEFETFVGGKSYQINNGSSIISEAWASGNDNLAFDEKGNLWVQQDGSRNHIWMVRPDHTQDEPKVELFMRTPTGSEPTGMTFTPDHRFMFVSIQHPSSSNVNQPDASGNTIRFNLAATAIVARKDYLGISYVKADFRSDKRIIRQGETVTFKDLSAPAIRSRVWNISGVSDSVQTITEPVITYNQPGTYAVKLKVMNKFGADSMVETSYITVLPAMPVINFTADRTEVFEGDTVTLNDLSTGLVENRNWTLTGSNVLSSADAKVKVVYSRFGQYTVKLAVGNSGDSVTREITNYITVKRRLPIPSIGVTTTTIIRGSSISFTDLSKNIVKNRKWTINGGQLVKGSWSDSIIQVRFNTKGQFTVKLLVSNEAGADSLVKSNLVIVNPPAPYTEFTADKNFIQTGGTVKFDEISTEDIVSRSWEFEGGVPATSTQPSVTVTYPNPGSYSVKLTSTNVSGSNTKLKMLYVTVSPVLGVAKIDDLADLTVFPNDVTDEFKVHINVHDNSSVFMGLYDTKGNLIKQIMNKPSFAGAETISVDASDLSPGMYIVNLKINNQSASYKIIKK